MSEAQANPKNILLLSGGSKVAIARLAKQAAQRRGATLHISDTHSRVPTQQIADRFTELPPCSDPSWPPALAELCRQASIGLILPTRHTELLALAQIAPLLRDSGAALSLSGSETIKTCVHKLDTYQLFRQLGVPTPLTFTPQTIPADYTFPLVAKPASGAASQGIRLLNAAEEISSVPDDWILQEKAKGIEFTVNLYLDKAGQPLCAIPHERIAVESGEVVRARTQRLPQLIELCEKVARGLPDAQGIINMQAFYEPATQAATFIEINPRIGGGYPLCDAAKGPYIEWLCQEHLDGKAIEPFHNWTENLLMMRYKEALFSL